MPSTNTNTSRSTAKFPVSEFMVLFVPVMLLFIIAGVSIVSFRTESQVKSLIDEDSIKLHHISGFVGAYIAGAFNQLQSIAGEPEIKNAINDGDSEALKSLEKSFLRLAQRNPVYDQVRWIDETGFEQTRISRGQNGPYTVSRQNLQDKSQRYYFKDSNSLPLGELYASKIDLNVEHGKVVLPPKSMLRIATPVIDSKGKRRGIIIINILMAPAFKTVQYLEQAGKTGNYILLNQQGGLIYGSIQLPGMKESNQAVTSFSTAYPAIWQSISSSEAGHLELSDGIWTWKKATSFDNLIGFKSYNSERASGVEKQIEGEFSLIFVVQRPLGLILEMRRNVRVSTFAGVFVALLVYGILLYFFLSVKFRARQAMLEVTYARINADSMARLKEHEERFHRLVESSSIGQLVVNSEGKIEISNATVEQMLGYEKYELNGATVETLLPSGKQQAHLAVREEYMQNPRPRKMGEGRELEALRKDGTTIPVEVGLNPYTEQNRQLVLVNIIDLSSRKAQG